MPIYTRKGDKGQTSLWGGTRVSKSDIRVETYGTVDELNSVIGVVLSQIAKRKSQNNISKLKNELISIQNDLLDIGSQLANLESSKNTKLTESLKERVVELEKLIDKLTEAMPPLRNFILPGGGKAGALLHLARTICRRAERKIVDLLKKEEVNEGIIMYFNRLSDLLFTMARFVNYKEKKKETIWNKQY